MIEEMREFAIIKLVYYQQKLSQGYDRGIKTRTFVLGNLVLRRDVGNMKNPA